MSFHGRTAELRLLDDLWRSERAALLVDEFTYLLEANPGIAGSLQNAWDHLLKAREWLLVISGSHLGMVQRHALSVQAPLYGRATARIHLQPLPYGVSKLSLMAPAGCRAGRPAVQARPGWQYMDARRPGRSRRPQPHGKDPRSQ